MATLLFRLYTSLTFFGKVSSIIAYIFSGLTSIPLWDTMNLRNFPIVTPNAHFLKVVQMVILQNALYQHVIHVDLNVPPDLSCEHFVH